METVVKCDEIKQWNGKPIYGVGLSDGQGGESFQLIPVGTPVSELVISPNPPYGNKIKWNKGGAASGGGGYAGRQRSGNESFALSYAKDLGIAYVGQGKNIEPAKIIAWADQFYAWLEKKKAATAPAAPVVLASQIPPKPAAAPAPTPPADNSGGSDDLPF